MKVALLTREYPPEIYGGAGVHVEYLAPALAAHVDLGVRCFGAQRDDPLVAATYSADHGLGRRPEDGALAALAVDVAMVGDLGGVDLVHSHTWYTSLAGHLAKLTWGIPHVMTAHSLEPLRPWKAEQLGGGYALSCWAERVAIESADAVIAVSLDMRNDVLRTYPAVDPDRVHVVHNGIDAAAFSPTSRPDVVARFAIEAPYVMFVGRVTRQKGLVPLLRAAPSLGPGTTLVVCAGAADTPETMAQAVRARNAAREAGARIVWIDGMLPRPELVALLSAASVFVCPSVYEPFGLINLEAMACATPVVANAVGGVPEVVADGETGVLVPAANGDEAATELMARAAELVHDPVRAAAMGAAGRARVLEHFSWPSVARDTVDVYEAVASR